MSWRTVVGGGQVTVGVTAQVSKSASLVGAVPPELHYLVYWILEPLSGPGTTLATHRGGGYGAPGRGGGGARKRLQQPPRHPKHTPRVSEFLGVLVSLGVWVRCRARESRQPGAVAPRSECPAAGRGQSRVPEHWSAPRPAAAAMGPPPPLASLGWSHTQVVVSSASGGRPEVSCT